MKKILLLAAMAVVGLTVSAQRDYKHVFAQQGKTPVVNKSEVKRSYQAVAPYQAKTVSTAPLGKKLTLDASKLQPVTNTKAAKNLNLNQHKALRKSITTDRPFVGLQATKNVKEGSVRKAPAFQPNYTGKGTDYYSKSDTAWAMRPAVLTLTYEDQTTEDVNVLVDPIPLTGILKDVLSELYPEGLYVEYTQQEDIITIQPQSIARYSNEAGDSIFFISIFSGNNEDGVITLHLGEDGLLTFTEGNWIGIGEFVNVPFDEEFLPVRDGGNYNGMYELYAYIRYIYDGQKEGLTSEKDYNAHGVDVSENQGVSWTMSRGTYTEDGVDYPVFINLTPPEEFLAGLYPDGIYVDYEQDGNTVTIKPQVIATMRDDDGETEYLMLFSGTNEDTGEIVLNIADDGTIKTIDGESVMISAWSTNKYDNTFETYLGYYVYIDRVKYMLPDAAPEAPADVAFEPNELVLFAGLGLSGYSYNNNLGVFGAGAPVSFRNATLDIATNYEWTAVESDEDDNETTITGTETNFGFTTKPGAVYNDITLVGVNQTVKSEPYTWGYGHCPNSDGSIRYENAYYYAGQGGGSFDFTDGTYATMTRQNPDGDLTFYTNWGTPDIYESTSIAKIYSYQGKPSTPLFLTGVTLPMVSFKAEDDFNLHITLYKCTRTATGRLTLGDVIAEGDATIDNVNADYSESSGLTSVDFNELYVEDEFGMSETLDYLFIEDEFVIVIDGWDNGTFSGVLGSQDITGNEITSTWFARTGNENEMRAYSTWKPALFIGLIDATYGYLYTEDDTNLSFGAQGGSATIHVDPMYYDVDEETEEYTYLLYIEKITTDGEEAEEVPEWLKIDVANEDYTIATGLDDEGEEYSYFANGIDYDLVLSAEALPEGVQSRSVEVVFMQPGARLVVTVNQDNTQGISTVVSKEPVKTNRAYNLAGQDVKAHRGIVIKDGKKLIVR